MPIISIGWVPAAMAQDAPFADDDAVTKASAALDLHQKQIDSVNADLGSHSANDRDLMAQKSKVDDVLAALVVMKAQISPRLDEVTARLADLGAPPKEGSPVETLEVTTQRNKLAAQKTTIVSILARIDDTTKEANDLSSKISAARRQLFTQELFAHADVSLDSMSIAVNSIGPEISQFVDSMGNWLSFVFRLKAISLASALVLSLGMMLGLRVILNRIFGPIIARGKQEQNPSYMSRFSIAFWGTLLPSLAFSFFLVSTFLFLDMFNVLRPDIRRVIGAVLGFCGLVFFSTHLALAVFNPISPKWRLLRVTDRGSYQLVAAFVTMSVVNSLDYVLSAISEAQSWPVEITVMKGVVTSIIVGVVLLLVSFTRPLLPKEEDERQDVGRPWSPLTSGLLRILGAAIIFSALLGYVGLARFIATQIVLTGGVICTMYIGIRSGRAVSERDRFAETIVGRYFQRRFSIGPVALDQMGIIAGLLIYGVAVMIGVPLIMMSWGFQLPDIRLWIYNLFTEIKIGSISISVVGIAGGVLLFAVGIVVTRWLEKWLDGNIMVRAQVDAGVRNSIKTVVGYVGAVLAAVIGLSAAGINLSNLALVAGALSLGIGFGLQNIVSNFVSGLILLVERPFKVGDWVLTGTTEGFVRRINVRATEIETFQRQTIIVPNSELINAAVGNWTHRNTLGRVDVLIGVSYNSDPQHVMDVLKEVAQSQEGVLRNPEPFVIFLSFGASSLDFQLSFFIGDVLNGLAIKNGVRVKLMQRLREEGIEIPYPHQDLKVILERAPAKGPGQPLA
ncbi:small-conductance mechanosensitive channel [Agrobacterium vitis]|nr:small-conductance mechanosensitive channel [Agrobacterium vitis]MBE1437698.1 small-conductance mechanosensitive channel [Agrobacterium vitis]